MLAPSPMRAPKAFVDRLRLPEPRSESCLNCATALTGPFCSACGQRDIPPYPNVRELVTDAFWELSGWDGRFTKTVRVLVTQPGALTREFLEGRRARYLSPLRLYLMASLLYFLIAPFSNAVGRASGVDFPGIKITTTRTGDSLAVGAPRVSRAQRVTQTAENAVENQQAVSPAQRDSMLKEIARAPAPLRPLLRRSMFDPTGFKRGIFEAMPRVLFVLVPVFAAIVALFYHRRKYPEHLYFAIHLHAFIFVALSLSALAKLTHVGVLMSVVKFIVIVSIPVYATIAFRRLYGGSMTATVAKGVGVVILNSIAGIHLRYRDIRRRRLGLNENREPKLAVSDVKRYCCLTGSTSHAFLFQQRQELLRFRELQQAARDIRLFAELSDLAEHRQVLIRDF